MKQKLNENESKMKLKEEYEMKQKLLVGLLCLLVLSLATAYGGGGNYAYAAPSSINISVAHVLGIGSDFDWGSNKFKELLEKKSGGRITATIYPSDLTADEIEATEMLQAGNLDIGWLSTGNLSGFVQDLMLFEMPFLFRDDDHIEKVLTGPFGQNILEQISGISGIVGLAFHVDGWRQITNNLRPINSIDDLKGMKIRTMMNPICIAMYKALGATPIPINSAEIYTSIQTGIVNGQDNGVLCGKSVGYLEIQPYVAMISHFYSAGAVIASEKFWDSLSAEDQALVKEAAEEAGAGQRKWFWTNEIALAKELSESGKYTVTYPNDRDAWVAACEPVYQEYFKKYPKWKEYVEIIRNTK